uniref:Uncharacterized protein n=1 Tax=Candidatus Aramenus sulfurataquae TaxID=1326980 RepID=A0A0F2LTF9_9CREN
MSFLFTLLATIKSKECLSLLIFAFSTSSSSVSTVSAEKPTKNVLPLATEETFGVDCNSTTMLSFLCVSTLDSNVFLNLKSAGAPAKITTLYPLSTAFFTSSAISSVVTISTLFLTYGFTLEDRGP